MDMSKIGKRITTMRKDIVFCRKKRTTERCRESYKLFESFCRLFKTGKLWQLPYGVQRI